MPFSDEQHQDSEQEQGSGNHIQNHAGKQTEKPCKSYQQGQDQGYREQRQLY